MLDTQVAGPTALPESLNSGLADVDPEIHEAMRAELARQETTLEMIASDNVAPLSVMQAQGSVLTNKYAEGYPGRRYYGGCEHVDVVERLAVDRLKDLFGATFANVQPHSGAQANAAAMAALLQPGDTILGLDLAHGGHLTHGKKLNSAVFPGQQGGPLEHVIAAKAVAFKLAATEAFRDRQERTLLGARLLADRLLAQDSRAAGIGVVSGGTDVHLVLVDLRHSELDGKQAEDRLHAAGITVNRNAVPFDPRPPMVSSGIRVGTSALATRGLQVEDFDQLGQIIAAALGPDFDAVKTDLRHSTAAIADKYP